jgi:hypothetical protein
VDRWLNFSVGTRQTEGMVQYVSSAHNYFVLPIVDHPKLLETFKLVVFIDSIHMLGLRFYHSMQYLKNIPIQFFVFNYFLLAQF